MQILETRVMRGPNYWSNFRKNLIVMKLDIGEWENFSTNLIDGFCDRLKDCMPSLYSHRCSPGIEGGFLERVKNGTWLGHVIEHVALEMQSLAGMPCGYGRTRNAGEKGVYNVVFSYEIEKAGLYAAKAAVRMIELLSNDMYYNIDDDISNLKKINSRYRLGPSTQSIIDEAVKRGIPYKRLNNQSHFMLGQGKNQKQFCATIAATTSDMGVSLAGNKENTKRLLEESFIPVPKGKLAYNEEELDQAIIFVGFPLVIKPLNGNHGRGITTNIMNKEEALNAFIIAKNISREVIVEKFIIGNDYRFLVINYKLVAVAKRIPAKVIGDDKSTIKELIDETNRDPNRGEGHECTLTAIRIDDSTLSILAEKNYNLNTVLPIGEILYLKYTANISTGGTSRDVTDLVHPDNVFIAERIARLMNLDICGIDIMAVDINVPITKENGAVLEVNAAPGFRMHCSPAKGMARNVAEHIIDMFYPENAKSRIPLVAITGTNGKTTTTRLVAHLAKSEGHNVGFTTTEGIYINNKMIFKGDCSGPSSASAVMRDPIVDFAVLECARGGILRSGLGFDKCDISIITNITADHLGMNGINTLDDLARVKEVVAQSTDINGHAILNADDDLVYSIKKRLDCKIALFSMNSESERIKSHCENGGLAAFIENDYFVVLEGKWKTRIAKVTEVPLTFGGTAESMIKNVLPSILVAIISNFNKENLINALKSFLPSPEMTPGRMNLFKFNGFDVMVDFAHNEGGYSELEKYMSKVKASVKVGIVAATGDRRDDDIRIIGAYAAKIFDEVIIRNDKNGRGRTNEEINSLVIEGIRSVDSEKPVCIISDEKEAIQHALDHAVKGSFIMVCSDDILETIEFIKRAQLSEGSDFQNLKYASS